MIAPHQHRQLVRTIQRIRANAHADAADLVRATTSIIIGGPGGIGELAGDVVGQLQHTIVEALRGLPLLTIPPSTGDALVWNGSAWGPGAPGADPSGPAPGVIIDYSTLVNEALVGRGASATAITTRAGSSPTNAIDNDEASWHDTDPGAAPATPVPVEGSWLRVDLGIARDITWFRWKGFYAPTWKIQSSTNDSTWTDRYSGTGSETSLQDTSYVDLSGTITARYWRIYALSGPADEDTHYYPLRTFTLALFSGAPLIQAPGHVIEDEGTPLTQRNTLNFVGGGVTVTDDSGAEKTLVTIPGSGLSRYATDVGDGMATTITVTHSLGTRDVVVSVRLAASPYTRVEVDWTAATTTTVVLTYEVAPASAEHRITVIG